MVCLLAAPWVQLSVSSDIGWPHNALRHHWLMTISCHFWDCKALLVMSLTHVSSAITSVQTFTFYNDCKTSLLLLVRVNKRPTQTSFPALVAQNGKLVTLLARDVIFLRQVLCSDAHWCVDVLVRQSGPQRILQLSIITRLATLNHIRRKLLIPSGKW